MDGNSARLRASRRAAPTLGAPEPHDCTSPLQLSPLLGLMPPVFYGYRESHSQNKGTAQCPARCKHDSGDTLCLFLLQDTVFRTRLLVESSARTSVRKARAPRVQDKANTGSERPGQGRHRTALALLLSGYWGRAAGYRMSFS